MITMNLLYLLLANKKSNDNYKESYFTKELHSFYDNACDTAKTNEKISSKLHEQKIRILEKWKVFFLHECFKIFCDFSFFLS